MNQIEFKKEDVKKRPYMAWYAAIALGCFAGAVFTKSIYFVLGGAFLLIFALWQEY